MNINIKDFKEALLEINEDDFNDSFIFLDTIIKINNHTFDIMYKPILHSLNIIIKPKKKYTKYEFEKLFGFKPNCEDYNDKKIIKLIHN
jgi:hypothetical protein